MIRFSSVLRVARTARAPPRRTAGARGSPGTAPSAPTRRRRTSSRCTARAPRAARRPGTAGRRTTGVAVTWSSQSIVSRFARACSYGSSGCSLRVAVAARAAPPARRGCSRSNASRRSSLEQARHDVDDARGVEHVHGRPAVLRRDLHRRVLPAGRRAADQQRQRRCRAAPSPARRTPSRRATA